jgi:hypothetical protein
MRSIALAAALLIAGAPAGAELYRCTSPVGAVLVTDDARACPGAERLGSAARVTRHGAAQAEVAPSQPSARATEGEAGPQSLPPDAAVFPADRPSRPAPRSADEAIWRSYFRQKQDEQREVAKRIASLESTAKRACDEMEHGRQSYACRLAKAELEGERERAERLEAYLADGIEDDCRVAGCLPGWVR